MKAEEARQIVRDRCRLGGWQVYEPLTRPQVTAAVPHLAVCAEGQMRGIRVQVGNVPRKGPMYVRAARVGECADVVAVVHPHTGEVIWADPSEAAQGRLTPLDGPWVRLPAPSLVDPRTVTVLAG